MDINLFDSDLDRLFGPKAYRESPLGDSGMGCRLVGIDLAQSLDIEQVTFLLNALSEFRVLCIPGQDLSFFSLDDFEQFANHWGAPVPHPSNFLRGGKPAQSDGDSSGPFELIPFEKRRAAKINTIFPDRLKCLEHNSPAVLVVSNIKTRESGTGSLSNEKINGPGIVSGGSWHTDIEYEPIPIYVSMFLAHHLPSRRDSPERTWIGFKDVDFDFDPFSNLSHVESSEKELVRLRNQLPLNGETAFADTAAAFSELPTPDQVKLIQLRVRRRLNAGDPGWLAPLVRTNPRSKIRSLHSPVWASRPGIRPPIEVEGMSMTESRNFLDRLESHVLQRRFRYDHLHRPGDVVIWDNYMTLHTTPFIKETISSIDDVRILYRLSCKGEPAVTLPRNDPSEWLKKNIPGGYSTQVIK